MATIHCEDCGEARTRVPSNTKYCKACRLLRDLQYWRRNRRFCKACKVQFAPLNRADTHCTACNPGYGHLPVENCAMGTGTGALRPPHDGFAAVPGIPVCADCLRASDMREELMLALVKGQRLRKGHNNATT